MTTPRPHPEPQPEPRPAPRPGLTLASAPTALGLTTRQAEHAAILGLTNLGKILAYLPTRHETIEPERPIRELKPGDLVTTRGEITATRIVPRGRRPRFEAVLHDGSDRLDLVWFGSTFMRDRVKPGVRARVRGKARSFGPGLQIANPSLEILRDDAPASSASSPAPPADTPSSIDPAHPATGTPLLPDAAPRELRPVYPATAEVPSSAIARIIAKVLPKGLPLIHDHLPSAFRQERGLPELREAYRAMHRPRDPEDLAAARRRLAYDELFMLQVGVALRRERLRRTLHAPALPWSEEIDRRIRARLPHTPTPGQEAAIREIIDDATTPIPMNRLLQGDVGSGKTLVAAYGMLLAAAAGRQAALMAPTEVLAEQHAANIARILAGSRVRMELLTGSMDRPARDAALARIADGHADIVLGTHALFSEGVSFKSLAFCVIDEQHRFGVRQRLRLRERGSDDASTPHVLVMTATPIPRTLALTLLGDLDVSTIDGLPPGRLPIRTRVCLPIAREDAYAEAAHHAREGGRVYIVAPAIDGGVPEPTLLDADDPTTSTPTSTSPTPVGPVPIRRTIAALQRELPLGPLAGVPLGIVHGRLPAEARDATMAAFRRGDLRVLLATTVIEVGVDVPEATLMIVEEADRFGLAQLHQLRGRVGRGSTPGSCILLTDRPTPEALARLAVLERVTDGFELAEEDLRLRGPGAVFSTRQSGAPEFRVADLSRDMDLLHLARRDARAWLEKSPTLSRPGDALLRRRMLKAFGTALGLGDVG